MRESGKSDPRDSRLHPEIEQVVEWIDAMEFSYPEESSCAVDDGVLDRPFNPTAPLLIASPVSRIERRTKAELDELLKTYRQSRRDRVPSDSDLKRIWDEARDPKSTIQSLDPSRVSPDSIAFYRPFHLPPADEWGIYILVEPLLKYAEELAGSMKSVRMFTMESLTLCVLFEVFHHEFFHHMVESTATSLELIFAASGVPRPVYLPYCESVANLDHEDTPIEEAMANAYAYTAFSFIVKVGKGYGAAFSKLYQEALKKSWPKEGDGYRSAVNYIDGGTTFGSTMLLNLMLRDSLDVDTPTSTLATHLFPRGHTALLSKPQIPTYIVGSPAALAIFNQLIPAPNEAYTALFIASTRRCSTPTSRTRALRNAPRRRHSRMSLPPRKRSRRDSSRCSNEIVPPMR